MTLDPLPPVESAPPAPRPFRAGRAFLSLGLMLLAQVVTAVVITIVCMAVKGVGAFGSDAGMQEIAVPILLGLGLASVAGVALAVRFWAMPLARDRGRDGLGFFLPGKKALIAGAAAGAAVAAGYIGISLLAGPEPPAEDSFMAQAVAKGGFARFSWAILALLFAPCYEEILFRGLLWKGFSASWGRWPAGILVTAIFTGLHFSEVKGYWPAALGIATMAVVALVARIRTGSLATAMAVHVGYNGVIVVLTYLQG